MKDDTISRQAAIVAVCKSECESGFCGVPCPEVDALKALPSAQLDKLRWIPCSERLPEDDVEVFVYLFERQTPYIAWVEDCRWHTEDFEVEKENYPTAWMPMPEPYKEDDHEIAR